MVYDMGSVFFGSPYISRKDLSMRLRVNIYYLRVVYCYSLISRSRISRQRENVFIFIYIILRLFIFLSIIVTVDHSLTRATDTLRIYFFVTRINHSRVNFHRHVVAEMERFSYFNNGIVPRNINGERRC